VSSSPSIEAMLLRSVIATAVHDLGGLASALLLRADVLERRTDDPGVAALRSIATELRVLGEQLRALRVPEGRETLSPSRAGALAGWLERVRRFGKPLLGHGGMIDGQVHGDVHVDASDAHELTLVVLALLRDLHERWPEARIAVHITAQLLDDHVRVLLGATMHGQPVTISEADGSPWWQWAAARAAAADMPCRIDDGRVRLDVRRDGQG